MDKKCGCGGRLSYDPEPRRRSKRQVCKCDGYPYPHRAGTEPWCIHAAKGPTEKDFLNRPNDRLYRTM